MKSSSCCLTVRCGPSIHNAQGCYRTHQQRRRCHHEDWAQASAEFDLIQTYLNSCRHRLHPVVLAADSPAANSSQHGTTGEERGEPSEVTPVSSNRESDTRIAAVRGQSLIPVQFDTEETGPGSHSLDVRIAFSWGRQRRVRRSMRMRPKQTHCRSTEAWHGRPMMTVMVAYALLGLARVVMAVLLMHWLWAATGTRIAGTTWMTASVLCTAAASSFYFCNRACGTAPTYRLINWVRSPHQPHA